MMGPTLIETVRVRNGEAPLWGLHLRRLYRSCKALGVPAPLELEVPGGGADRVHRLEVDARGVRVSEREVGSPEPVRLVTSRVTHRPYPHKITQRDQFDRALSEARSAGADDALLLTEGGFAGECAIWGLFWWEGDCLCAPALELGVLPGVGRARIAELVRVEERRAPRKALEERSVFVANAARGIVEVAVLDGVRVPRAGATESLRARFWG